MPRTILPRRSRNRQERPVDRDVRSRRDPSQRRTAKPYVTLEQTSQTAILRTCMDTISECFNYGLDKGGRYVDAAHVRALVDAWDLLTATSSLVARGSELADEIKPACARGVKLAEESCEEFPGDVMMEACADVCREAHAPLAA